MMKLDDVEVQFQSGYRESYRTAIVHESGWVSVVLSSAPAQHLEKWFPPHAIASIKTPSYSAQHGGRA